MMRPKLNPVRSEPYRRLVAMLPCINCGILGFSQAAHGPTAGLGIKSDDLGAFPLCIQHGADGIGCHVRYDRYMLGDIDWRREKAREWGAKTRADVLAMKSCPAKLREILK